MDAVFLFHSPLAGQVDHANAMIRDVSLITGGIVAEGHDLHVDTTTLNQVLLSAQEAGQVPVKLNHGSGVENVCGYLENFHIAGNKVLGDWHLLKTHGETEMMLERAERMPGCFGLSVAFKGKGVDVGGGKKAARCEALKAVDCVASPAANPDGLFSAKEVDIKKIINMEDNSTPVTPEQLAALQAQLDAATAENATLKATIEGTNEEGSEITDEQLGQLAQMGDDQLAERGIARNDVLGALSERGYDVSGAGEGEGAGEGAGEMVGAGAETSAALSAIRNDLQEFKARENAKVIAFENSQVEHAFATLGAKAEALVELNAKLVAELTASKATITRFQSKGASAGIEGRTTLFAAKGSEVHEFQEIVNTAKAGGKTDAEALRFAIKENPVAHRDFINSQAGK